MASRARGVQTENEGILPGREARQGLSAALLQGCGGGVALGAGKEG